MRTPLVRKLTVASVCALVVMLIASAIFYRKSRTFAEPVHVVIYLIDTLRADRLSVYGYSKPTSPAMKALAEESVVFEQASSAGPWTLPSVVSILTSTFPCEHGILIDGQRIGQNVRTLAERLKAADFSTASLVTNAYAGPMSGLHRGNDVMKVQSGKRPSLSAVEAWLNDLGKRSSFLYYHTTEPHDPLTPPRRLLDVFGEVSGDVSGEEGEEVNRLFGDYRSSTRVDWKHGRPIGHTDNNEQQQALMDSLSYRKDIIDSLYDASVHWADENLAAMVSLLKKRGVWDRTLLIVVADHGEEVGDHGGWQHDQSVYDELVHVPLIVRFPSDQYGGKRVKTPVSGVDIAPTILEYLKKAELGDGMRGASLMPLIRSQTEPDSKFVITAERSNRKKHFRPYKETRGDDNVVVRKGAWKAIWNVEPGTTELYNVINDPGETTDLAMSDVSRAKEAQEFARQWRSRCDRSATGSADPSTTETDSESLKRLRTLGYID